MLSAFCDGQVFGERTGTSAPQVLALHGWRKDHTDLARVVEGFNALTLDLPGFGTSPAPSSVWGGADYASGLESILNEFESPPVVFGHSFGGRVAVNMAALYPERVRAVVLAGVPLIRKSGTKRPPVAYRAAKLANRVGLLSDQRMEAERRKRGSADYNAATGIVRDIFVKVVNESYEQQLRSIVCPAELVWGENDTEASLRQAEQALEILTNAKLTVVPGGSHWIVNTDPQPIRDAITRSLR